MNSLRAASGATLALAYALQAQAAREGALSGLTEPRTRLAPRLHVDLAIPAYREERYIPSLLISARNQVEPFTHVVVADCSDNDLTAQAARAYGAAVVRAEYGNISRSRNLAARSCGASDIVVFSDADVVFPQMFVKKAVDQLLAGAAACHPRETIYDSLPWNLLFYGPNLFRRRSDTTRCLAVWRDAWEQAGGYNEDCSPVPGHGTCREDLDMGQRIIAQFGDNAIAVLDVFIATSGRRFKKNLWEWPWHDPAVRAKAVRAKAVRAKAVR